MVWSASLNALTFDTLLKQGKIRLTLSDIDGYAYTIPEDKRAGFFNSPDRIDKTIKSIHNMNILVNYGEQNNLIDQEIIDKIVDEYIFTSKDSIQLMNLTDYEFSKLIKFLKLQASFKFFKDKFLKEAKKKDLSQLAQEYYKLNKQKYYHEKLFELDYINVFYNNENKKDQLHLITSILESLMSKKATISDYNKKYLNSKNVEIVQGIKDFEYDEKYQLFSDFVKEINKTGLIEKYLDAGNRYIIVNINKIKKSGHKAFIDVKDQILSQLQKEQFKRDYEDLILSLTKDPIEVNEESIISLRTRYLPKTNN